MSDSYYNEFVQITFICYTIDFHLLHSLLHPLLHVLVIYLFLYFS